MKVLDALVTKTQYEIQKKLGLLNPLGRNRDPLTSVCGGQHTSCSPASLAPDQALRGRNPTSSKQDPPGAK